MIYQKVLLDSIEEEKQGHLYRRTEMDNAVLKEMFQEINLQSGLSIQYVAELDFFHIKGMGTVFKRYITRFNSETIRAYLVHQLVTDGVEDCEGLILQMYLHFKESDEYISKPGKPAPSHIYVRYDNAFRQLKPRKLKGELINLVKNPRDMVYLPLTTRMLASWKDPRIRDILIPYLTNAEITPKDVEIEMGQNYYPSLEYMKRQLLFSAIGGLKYFPTEEVYTIIKRLSKDSDPDIRQAANRSLKTIFKKCANSL